MKTNQEILDEFGKLVVDSPAGADLQSVPNQATQRIQK